MPCECAAQVILVFDDPDQRSRIILNMVGRLLLHSHLACRAKAAVNQLKLAAERLAIPLNTTSRVHLEASPAKARRAPSDSFTPVRGLERERRHGFPVFGISFAPRESILSLHVNAASSMAGGENLLGSSDLPSRQ
jgi:hypothetical protein